MFRNAGLKYSLDIPNEPQWGADEFLDLQELIYAFIRGPDPGRRTLGAMSPVKYRQHLGITT